MPNLTTTIEDTSPVIVYSDGWGAGSSTEDALVERYSDSSYTKTNVSQASLSFSFYGNGVQLFGGKRLNYSRYQVTIDKMTYPIRDASVSDPQGIFQTSLFSTIALSVGYHTVQLTNVDPKTLDLDFITWQTPVGSDDGEITAVTVQDSDSSFEYVPSSQWNPNVPNPGMYSGGSGHLTYTAGSSARLPFKGKFHSQTFTLRNHTHQGALYNYMVRSQQLLFQASNLGSGEHSIAIRSETGANSTVYFAFDYVQVFTTASSSGSLSVAQIAGIVIGSVCGLLLLGILIFLLLSKRGHYSLVRKKEEDRNVDSRLVIEPFSNPQTPLYDAPSVTPQHLKGQLSHGSMTQNSQPLTATSFSGESLYTQPDLNPFPLTTVRPSSGQLGQPSSRTPRILDEKKRLPSDTTEEPSPEMTQTRNTTTVTPVIESSQNVEPPPLYLK